ncbi:MAG: SCO family protein [Paludisphaera borealis]|uniref:SCO family protein n=1 Tax=Paludisphaera borealis TaxID=1387353 RepID=UPI00283D5F1A|nr:SCO family protein [Paludisphaera borealis]MDR3618614.1 SCO family protein [Paludisphaera borealis]
MPSARAGSKIIAWAGLGVVCGLAFACACGPADEPAGVGSSPKTASASGKAAAAPKAETKNYALKGEVRKIEKESHQLVIRHEAIPGFMGAMTMPFQLPKETDFDDFQVGDIVEGTLRVEFENGETSDYQLQDLAVSKPALAAPPLPLVVDSSGKAVSVLPRSKRLEPGEAVPDFTMTGEDGKTSKLSDLRGHVVVLTFIYTRCPLPDFCPAMDRRFAELAQSLSTSPSRSEKVRLVSLSFDPENDTPEVLRKHARIRGATPPLWTFAVASHDELAKIAVPLGLVYGPGKNEIIHNLCTAVIGPDGKLVRLEVGTKNNRWTTADLLKTLFPTPSPG